MVNLTEIVYLRKKRENVLLAMKPVAPVTKIVLFSKNLFMLPKSIVLKVRKAKFATIVWNAISFVNELFEERC